MSGSHTINEPPPPYEYATGNGAPPNPNPRPSQGATPLPDTTQPEPQRQPSIGGQQQQSAAAYFASRPSRSSQVYTHLVQIRPNTRRGELVYPAEWASSNHDVSADDWNTFVGYLLPEATGGGMDEKRLSEQRIRDIDGVVREWNQGFFEPRGVLIRWEDGMGGGTSGSQSAGSSSRVAAGVSPSLGPRPPQRRPSQGYPSGAPGPHNRPHPPAQLPPRGSLSTKQRLAQKIKDAAKERDVAVTASKIRVGEMFSLDATSKNLRIGKFSLSEKGMDYDGRPLGPQLPPPHHSHGGYPQHPHGPPYNGGRGYGARPDHQFNSPPHYPEGHRPPAHYETWGPSPRSAHTGGFRPQHSHTWTAQGPPSYGGSNGGYGNAPSLQHGSAASQYDGYTQAPPQGPPPRHADQTTGTTG